MLGVCYRHKYCELTLIGRKFKRYHQQYSSIVFYGRTNIMLLPQFIPDCNVDSVFNSLMGFHIIDLTGNIFISFKMILKFTAIF